MKVKLTEQALLDAARGSTGLADFGDEADWHEGFQRLVQSLNEEARLNAVGRLIAFNELLRHLENRLRVTEDLKRHPGILDVEIVKPLFMVGLPRTGSTIMHDLLAKDPANRVPMTWECHLMSPPAKRQATRRIHASQSANSTSNRPRGRSSPNSRRCMRWVRSWRRNA